MHRVATTLKRFLLEDACNDETDYDSTYCMSKGEDVWEGEEDLPPPLDSNTDNVSQLVLLDGDHVILPYAELIDFLQKISCRGCGTLCQDFQISTVGIATGLSQTCKKCQRIALVEPEMVSATEMEMQNGNYCRRSSPYALNIRLILLTHYRWWLQCHPSDLQFLLFLSTVVGKVWHKIED
jgi:hypothetical protein